MRLNPAKNELILKIVYCGPGLAGKTTSLQFLHSRIPAGRASGLISVDTHSQRTLQFDFGSVDLGTIRGMEVRLELFTVPGQSYYAATRRNVLAGADGIVFVADSRAGSLDENVTAMNEMLADMRHHGMPTSLPLVLQFNKQDLAEALPPDRLALLLNSRGWAMFPSVATTGEGVVEAFEALAIQLSEACAAMTLETSTGAPVPDPLPPPPTSWLITCFRCQAMLDVPRADQGRVYECPTCHTKIEVVDGDRGITQRPGGTRSIARTGTGAGAEGRGHGSGIIAAAAEDDLDHDPDLPPPAPARPPSGTAAIPGYTVIAVLDEGLQGSRLRVRDEATGKTYRALVLAPDLLEAPGYRAGIEPYARMAGPIRHPHLLPMTALRITPGDPVDQVVFVSVDPEGFEPLTTVLARRRALAPPHAITIIQQLALALEEGARHGAVHGWLRPDVVLINGNGQVLLDELCVPKRQDLLVGRLKGVSTATEYYLAPEHLGEQPPGDIRADIFGLGALLFRMLTGEGLITGRNAIEALSAFAVAGPRSLRETQAGISRELDVFHRKLVHHDPEQRFQTYRSIIDALDQFGGGARRQNLQLTNRMVRRAPLEPAVAAEPESRAATRTTGTHRRTTGDGATRTVAKRATGSHAPIGAETHSSATRHAARPGNDRLLLIGVPAGCLLLVVGVLGYIALSRPAVSIAYEPPAAAAPPISHPAPMPPRPAPTPPPAAPALAKPMPASPAAPVPPAAAPAPPAAAKLPAPGESAPTPPPSVAAAEAPEGASITDSLRSLSAQRMELRRTIAEQMIGSQWAAAMASAGKLRDPKDQEEAKTQILQYHQQRQHDVEAMAARGEDSAALQAALEPFTGAQALPEDAAWVATVLGSLANRPANAPRPGIAAPARPPVAVEPPPPAPAPAPVPVALAPVATVPASAVPAVHVDDAPVNDPEIDGMIAVGRALLNHAPAKAQATVADLPAAAPAVPALRAWIAWWPARLKLLNRVAAAKSARLRITHPITQESVDLTQADDRDLTLVNPKGATMALPWSQATQDNVSSLVTAAAAAPGLTAEDAGGAIALLIANDDPAQASGVVKRQRGLLGPQAGTAGLLIDLAVRRAVVGHLNQGFTAVRAGNTKVAEEALAAVRQADPRLLERYRTDVARLTAAVSQPRTAGPAIAPAEVPADVKTRQAQLRDLGWDPLGDAWLDGTAVRFQANGGIATALTSGVGGYSLAVTGSGYLRIAVVRGPVNGPLKGGILVPLAGDRPAAYVVAVQKDRLILLDATGTQVQSVPVTGSPNVFALQFTGPAVLSALPAPNSP